MYIHVKYDSMVFKFFKILIVSMTWSIIKQMHLFCFPIPIWKGQATIISMICDQIQCFCYYMQPIWTDKGEKSIEIQIKKTKNLSKFPSFFPERVSPRVFTNGRSSSRPSKPSPNNKDSGSEPEDNSCSVSSSESEAELEVLF